MKWLTDAARTIKTDPAAWAAETTTMIGAVLIGLGVWEVFAGALTCEQATGLVTAGVALLYPQAPAKQAATASVVEAVMEAFENRLHPSKVQEKDP